MGKYIVMYKMNTFFMQLMSEDLRNKLIKLLDLKVAEMSWIKGGIKVLKVCAIKFLKPAERWP